MKTCPDRSELVICRGRRLQLATGLRRNHPRLQFTFYFGPATYRLGDMSSYYEGTLENSNDQIISGWCVFLNSCRLQLLNRIREFLNEEEEDPPLTGGVGMNGILRMTNVSRNIWQGSEASGTTLGTDELIELEGCTQFHRIWSAIQFVFATPCGENEYTVEEMFGEGLNWAGCTLICLLGQQRRFEMLDFGAHFLKLQRNDKKDTSRDGVVSQFFDVSSGLRSAAIEPVVTVVES